ncbi:MAG: hypothetical protein ACTHNO_06715 [Ralstonia sp.]|uniref:hypothetical protein n=1 Tax=Ralstonia sp. TaxID=54061 RepID=UPI003F80CFE6
MWRTRVARQEFSSSRRPGAFSGSPSGCGEKKARNVRASNSAISLPLRALAILLSRTPNNIRVNVRFADGTSWDVPLRQLANKKNSPLKRRAENQLKKALSSGQGKCMKSVAAAALGYALIGCGSTFHRPSLSFFSSAVFGASGT